MDSFNRYKRFSEKLDVRTILCNKSWWVFNDSGEKEIYIFQEDGSLIISLNGNVTNVSWIYLSANQSLVINTKEQSYMLHPAFLDEKVLALQKDGTYFYSFMIKEEQLQSFWPKSLSDLNLYFERKRLAEVEAEMRRLQIEQELRQKRIQAQIEEQKRIQAERYKAEQIRLQAERDEEQKRQQQKLEKEQRLLREEREKRERLQQKEREAKQKRQQQKLKKERRQQRIDYKWRKIKGIWLKIKNKWQYIYYYILFYIDIIKEDYLLPEKSREKGKDNQVNTNMIEFLDLYFRWKRKNKR